jgi:hypothetical protein
MAGISMEEYVNAYYGGTLGISKRYGISKSDDNVDTTGLAEGLNTMFGAKVYNQLNTKSEVFKLLKKEPWTQSGFRALIDRHTTTAGVAESGAFPNTDHPELKEVTLTLKEIVTPWQMSSKAELLSEADDGLGNLAAFMRKENAEAHAYYIDDMLTKSVELDSDGSASGAGAGTAGVNMESLDRVTATLAYMTDPQNPSGGALPAAVDMYGLDISNSTPGASDRGDWFDAGYTHFTDAGTNNALELDDLDTGIAALLENGANYNSLIMLTGYDTYQNLKALMQSTTGAAFRYDLQGAGAANMNGVTGEAGLNFDSRVGAYDGIPIFLSQHVPKDDAARIYLLDMDNLAIRVAAPTTYVDNTNLAIRQVLSREYAFITAGELVAYRRDTSGSIRDLTA